MKRMRLLFALPLLLLFLPMWRYLDMLVFLWPSSILYGFSFTMVVLFFLLLPLNLIKPEVKRRYVFLGALVLGLCSWLLGSLSSKATKQPDFSHCGGLTFTGLFYPLHPILSAAPADDLRARNQLCWVRKMIVRSPRSFESAHEQDTYIKLTEQKLLSPEVKYRASLPFIAALFGNIYFRLETQNWQQLRAGKLFLDSLNFWKEHYTAEIHTFDYGWWDWPFSAYIKFEYGLVEKNWENLIEGIVIEEN